MLWPGPKPKEVEKVSAQEAGEKVSASTDEAGYRWLQLTHPPRNLLDPSVMTSLGNALTEADQDDGVKAIVITGDGEWFCGGLDVEQFKQGADPLEFATRAVELMKIFPRLGTPIVSAVNGNALALGYSI